MIGIRFHTSPGGDTSPGGVENGINGIPVIIEDNIIYIADYDKPLEENILHMDRIIIPFLNKISNKIHSFEDVIITRKKYIKRVRDYKLGSNDFSFYSEALLKGGKLWKPKFFKIHDNFLLYFKDDSAYNPEGVIPLENSIITLSQEYQNCLELETHTRRYHLRANNKDDIVIHMKKIQEASVLTINSLYKIQETIGQGTFAKVKRGIERSTNKEFAIKIINKDSVDQRESIMTEITILKNVSHPNIMKLHHVFESTHRIYIITELLEGGELFDLISVRGSLTEAETSKIMTKVVQAVAHLHTKNICHRDLKPENILLGIKGDIDSIRISDFGLSKISEDNLKTACGTPSYVAPEILGGLPYGFEVDMWSCGVILYVLLCGFPPFYSNNDADLYTQIQSGIYSFPSPYWDNISPIAKDLIQRLLVVDPSKRLTSVQFLLHPFIINYRSLSFNMGIKRELSSYLVTQKKLKKIVDNKLERI